MMIIASVDVVIDAFMEATLTDLRVAGSRQYARIVILH